MMEETQNVKVIEIDVDTDIEPPTAVKLYDVYQSIVSTITLLSRDLRDKNAAMEKAVAKVDELTAQKDKLMELIRSNIDESTVTSYDSLHQISRLFEAIAALKKSIDIITDDIHTLRRVAYYLHSKMAGRKGPQATPETDLYPNVES